MGGLKPFGRVWQRLRNGSGSDEAEQSATLVVKAGISGEEDAQLILVCVQDVCLNTTCAQAPDTLLPGDKHVPEPSQTQSGVAEVGTLPWLQRRHAAQALAQH